MYLSLPSKKFSPINFSMSVAITMLKCTHNMSRVSLILLPNPFTYLYKMNLKFIYIYMYIYICSVNLIKIVHNLFLQISTFS